MANGKAKGSSWEREVAKFLTKWVTGKEKPYVFWRSPSSGALQTISEALDASGDIIALRDEGKFLTNMFSIELKTGYPQASFDKHLKDTKNNDIKGFWDQCLKDALKAKKRPMLIFRKKGLQPIVGIDPAINHFLGEHVDLLYSVTLGFGDETPRVIFYDMNLFFQIRPEVFINISRLNEVK